MKPKPSELSKLFEDCHKEGSREFQWEWLAANEAAIQAAYACGFTPHDPKVKALLSLVVLKVLRSVSLGVR